MSLREAELARSQRVARSHTKQHASKNRGDAVGVGHNMGPAFAPQPDDDEVLSFAAWCKLNDISIRTGRQLRNAGNGPVVTAISDRRLGVTRRNNRLWQASRSRS